MFESRAKPALDWRKLKNLQTAFLERLKPAEYFLKGAKVHKKLGLYAPTKCQQENREEILLLLLLLFLVEDNIPIPSTAKVSPRE